MTKRIPLLLAHVVVLSVWSALASACPAQAPGADPAARATRLLEVLEPGLATSRAAGMSEDALAVARFLSDGAGGEGRAGVDAALEALARAYGLPAPDPGEPLLGAGDASFSASAAADVHAQAVLVTDDRRRDTVTHAAVYWNSPLAQRLRIVRIPEDLRREDNRDAILDLLGTCAVAVEEWVSAPQSLTLAFLSEHVRASMLVVGRDPASDEVVEAWVGPEGTTGALRFEHPVTTGLDEFSAWFTGEGPAPLALTRLIPTLRSSLGPGDLLELIRSLR